MKIALPVKHVAVLLILISILSQSCVSYKPQNFVVQNSSKTKLVSLKPVQFAGNLPSQFGVNFEIKSDNNNEAFEFISEEDIIIFDEETDVYGSLTSTNGAVLSFPEYNSKIEEEFFFEKVIGVFPTKKEKVKENKVITEMLTSKLVSSNINKIKINVDTEYFQQNIGNEINTIFNESSKSIMNDGIPAGYISYRIIDINKTKSELHSILPAISILTLGTINLLGLPSDIIEREVNLEVSIHDFNGYIIKTYKSKAIKSTIMACYYGYSPNKIKNASILNSYSLALSEIFNQMENDIDLINEELLMVTEIATAKVYQ